MEDKLSEKEKEIYYSLKEVIDPELMVNIVDLGLVYDVRLKEEDKKIEIDITLTSPGCPLGEMITADTENVVSSAFEGYAINVNIVWNPPWSMEKITAEGRDMLDGI